MKFEELLRRTLIKHNLYVGNCSVERIRAFIIGYATCMSDNGTFFEDDPSEFSDYVAQKYQVTSSHGWSEIILFYSTSQQDAYDKLLEAFREYYGDTDVDHVHSSDSGDGFAGDSHGSGDG